MFLFALPANLLIAQLEDPPQEEPVSYDVSTGYRICTEMRNQLPVESLSQLIALQPGVVHGHFRGGRSGETSYLLDGIPVTDYFRHSQSAIDPELSTLSTIHLMNGIYDAEFGRTLSGVVDAVTVGGENSHRGSASINAANYFTTHKDVFQGLSDSEFDRNRDVRAFVSGPLIENKMLYVGNLRYQDNKNHLNGIRRFNVDDFSDFSTSNPSRWYSEHNGDEEYVPLDDTHNLSLFAKLLYHPLRSIKLDLLYSRNEDRWREYNHDFKYNPDGMASQYREAQVLLLSLSHDLLPGLFYDFKTAVVDNYRGFYLYEDLTDDRYVHDKYLNSTGSGGFYTGGQQKFHDRHVHRTYHIKFDFTIKSIENHQLKSGMLFSRHDMEIEDTAVINRYSGTRYENQYSFDAEAQKLTFLNYDPVPLSEVYPLDDAYTARPVEFSLYVQDRFSLDNMGLYAGLRYDYFDPHMSYPSQYRNPINFVYFDDPRYMSIQKDAPAQSQLSPRLSAWFQPLESTRFYFGYGHFFQMPPYFAIFSNPQFYGIYENMSTVVGNAQIEAQKMVQNEIGIQHSLTPELIFNVTIFDRKYSGLLGTTLYKTYLGTTYGLFGNLSSGRSRGVEVMSFYHSGNFFAQLNYTLLAASGNYDTPSHFTTAASSWLEQPHQREFPLRWDQRHTVNFSLGFHTGRFGGTITTMYNSGEKYTKSFPPAQQPFQTEYILNGYVQPSQLSVDLLAYLNLFTTNRLKLRLLLLSYNVFDKLNDIAVYRDSGEAFRMSGYYTEREMMSHHSDFTDHIDQIQNPSMFAPPRLIKLGFELVY